MKRILLIFLLCCTANVPRVPLFAQEVSAPAVDTSRLPAALRGKGADLLKQTDEGVRARMADDLAKTPAAAAPFLLDLLDRDSSARVRLAIINRLGRYSDPAVRQALERHAGSDADVKVAMLALERLRGQETQQLRKLLERRTAMAKKADDREALAVLAREDERWVSLVRGTMLPAFLREVPPQFSLKPPAEPIRVLAFGDYGTGSDNQKRVAAAMLQYHKKHRFDFAITLGDNFYSEGMASPNDPRWKTWWEELYKPLGVRFYASLGNHDWGLADSPAAEILYSSRSSSWQMPAPYYTFTAGPAQFFALDTNEISAAQLNWLSAELDKSPARWKIVYGHHPVYSYGAHEDNINLVGNLLPVLKNRVDVYIAGHDHDLQHIQPEAGVQFFVSGGGGAGIRPITAGPRSLFAKSAHGFAVLEADKDSLTVRFVGADLSQLYEYKLGKPNN
ncbi:MAG TPA: metallophosphoesterase [Acidobacteriota bacterium]|jgi:hypothetical protein